MLKCTHTHRNLSGQTLLLFTFLGIQCNMLLEKHDTRENGERDLTGTIAIDESETEAGTMENEIIEDEKRDIDTEDEDFNFQEVMEYESEVEAYTELR